MCNFFSFRSDGNTKGESKFYYLDYEQRMKAFEQGNEPDSHTFIALHFGFHGEGDDMLNRYEYNPDNGRFTIDTIVSPSMNDSKQAEEWVRKCQADGTIDFEKLKSAEYDYLTKKSKEANAEFTKETGFEIGETCRFKTREEFEKEFGVNFQNEASWNPNGGMDYLFGKDFTIATVSQGKYLTSLNKIERNSTTNWTWTIHVKMLTKKETANV